MSFVSMHFSWCAAGFDYGREYHSRFFAHLS